jgi:hypothetical protein
LSISGNRFSNNTRSIGCRMWNVECGMWNVMHMNFLPCYQFVIRPASRSENIMCGQFWHSSSWHLEMATWGRCNYINP